jgi:hypothetical protein
MGSREQDFQIVIHRPVDGEVLRSRLERFMVMHRIQRLGHGYSESLSITHGREATVFSVAKNFAWP